MFSIVSPLTWSDISISMACLELREDKRQETKECDQEAVCDADKFQGLTNIRRCQIDTASFSHVARLDHLAAIAAWAGKRDPEGTSHGSFRPAGIRRAMVARVAADGPDGTFRR